MGQNSVAIPEKIFFKIGEVCDIVDVQAHVLRYWETEFPMLSPQKNRSGQRTYRRRDVEIALQIKDLLYEDLYTIAGAKKRLQSEMRESSKLKIVRNPAKEETETIEIEEDLDSIDNVELEIDSFEPNSSSTVSSFRNDRVELDEEKKDALKSLTSQLLELREMLKTDQTAEAEKHISKY
jgi:DNA-binding transcriptional MerR regulator